MFIAYRSANGKNVTLSPRIGSSHSEPVVTKDVVVTTLPGWGISNDTYIVNAKCSGCRKWHGGSLDLTSTQQPMIYAVGPDDSLQSDQQDAGIRRHQNFGEHILLHDMGMSNG